MYLIQKKIRIGKSTIENAGYGVFAEESISKNEIICECPLLTIEKNGDRNDYSFGFNGKRCIALGFGSLFNHSDNSNCMYKFENGLLKFYAIKDVNSNDELFFDYGKGYNKKYFIT